MKKLIKISKKISILILAISFFGCTNDDVELPKVIAGFTYTLNIDTGTVTFINISENSRSYVWTFGDGNSSTEINPIKTYENGTYKVTLKASNAAGASNIIEDEITILIPEIATLPITFDGENTNYKAVTFGGASFEIVDNPDPSGSNTSTSKVGAVTNIGAQFEGFYLDLGSPIDLSIDKTIKVNFWSNTPIDVLLKLEEGTGAPIEASTSHSGAGWEEIYFTFDSAGSYSRFTLFVDGPGTTAGTFYLDDISQIATVDIPCLETNLELPIDFDCNGIDYAAKIVGNVSFELVDNPELSGINSDLSKVGKITNIGENWENAFFNLDAPVDFTIDKGIKLKLFSDQALPIKLKFEDGTEAPVEADENHTGSGWEELTFTFISTASYNDMIIFVDGPGTAAGTFYIDDIEQVAGDVGEPCVGDTVQSFAASSFNISFETDPGTTETVGTTDKLLLGDVGYEYVDNPDFDNAVNSSCKVAKIEKAAGLNYANVQIFTADMFNFTDNAGFKLKIFSPNVGTNVLFKLEDTNNGGVFNQVSQLTTIANGWEELTFDFPASDTNKFDRIIIFFGFEQGDALTVHFDELNIYPRSGGGGGGTLVACSGGELINDFESSDNSIFNNFGGGVGTIETNTDTSVNTSATVAQYVKNAGEVFAGITIGLDSNIDFDAGVFSIDVSSQAVRQLLFKLEGLGIEVIIPT
ncbi:MAG: PKD domain-containing protein [Aureibaculum sp.]